LNQPHPETFNRQFRTPIRRSATAGNDPVITGGKFEEAAALEILTRLIRKMELRCVQSNY